ncbi:MAG: DUF4058 family protein [Caldilineaceae bacterium]
MPSPFPGMDPYLEQSEIWPSFHHRLADELADQLNPLIGPKYYADIEVRTVVEEVALGKRSPMVPATAVFERRSFTPAPSATAIATIAAAPVQRAVRVPGETKLRAVQIYSTEFGDLVTSIELLSPFNKQPRLGLSRYLHKRRKLLQSPVHLIEIDLLRGSARPGAEVLEPPLDTDYVLLVNRAAEGETRTSEIWPVALNQPLPIIPVPLLDPDPDVPLDLRAALDHIYERARYGWRIDYRQPVPPPDLRPDMAAWLKEYLPPPLDGHN